MEPRLLLDLILALILGQFAIETLAEVLNLRALDPELPEEFRSAYDAEKYRKALTYQRETTRFGILQSVITTSVFVAFICAGGFEKADLIARSFTSGEITNALAFSAILIVARFLLGLPFSLYSTFVIEEKFGFNRTTPRTFITDILKGAAIGGILGALVVSGLVFFFANAGEWGWLYAWIAMTLFQLGLVFIAPVWIMPLFNKFEPIEPGELRSAIEEYAQKEEFTLTGIFTMDASKRSTKTNAFFTGFGRFRRLVLFDALIAKQTVPELVAVVAHEVGHFKRKHIIKMMALSLGTSLVLFFAFSLLLRNPLLFEAFGMSHVSVYGSLILVSIPLSPVTRLISVFGHVLSRKHEFEADAYSVATYRKPGELISALKKLSMDNLSNLSPHPLKVALDYTHPPILQRISVLKRALP